MSRSMGERRIPGQRGLWICVSSQTHIKVLVFSLFDGSEVSGVLCFYYASEGENGF